MYQKCNASCNKQPDKHHEKIHFLKLTEKIDNFNYLNIVNELIDVINLCLPYKNVVESENEDLYTGLDEYMVYESVVINNNVFNFWNETINKELKIILDNIFNLNIEFYIKANKPHCNQILRYFSITADHNDELHKLFFYSLFTVN